MTTDMQLANDPAQFAPPIGEGPRGALGVLSVYADAIDMAYNFAEKLCRTPLVGDVYRGKPADAAVAILYGAELGLNPIQSLQNIFTVHGKPAIYSRTMVALLKVKGYRIDPIDSSDGSVTVVGYSPNGQEVESTWTIERAAKAGYVPQIDESTGEYRRNSNGKLIGNEKYLTDPQAMLYAKAAAEVCRKLAPDVLLGIAYSAEDLESEPAPVRVTSERVTPADATTAATGLGVPVVQQWQAPPTEAAPQDDGDGAAAAPADAEPASNQGEKPDTAQVDDSAKPATSAEQRRLSAQLELHGRTTRDAKLAYLSKQVGRQIGAANQLTGVEARAVAERLASLATSEQIEALCAALARDNVTEQADQLDWIRNNGAPDYVGFDGLDAELVENLTAYLVGEQAKDAARAAARDTAAEALGPTGVPNAGE